MRLLDKLEERMIPNEEDSIETIFRKLLFYERCMWSAVGFIAGAVVTAIISFVSI